MARMVHRSPSNRRLGGVCGGIGETYDLDPNVIRLAFVFIGLVTAFVPVAVTYFVAWLMLPEREVWA